MCTVQLAIAINSVGWGYDNILNEFKYIRLGPNFAQDREKCRIRLACQALRLSRWGAATGVYGGPAKNGLIGLHGWGDVEDLEKAQESLESITEIFEECRVKRTVREEQRQWLKGLVSD